MKTHMLRCCFGIALSFTLLVSCVSGSRGGGATNYPYWTYEGGQSKSPSVPSSTPAQGSISSGGGQKVWCVGKPAAEDLYLRRNIDFACGEGGIDCTHIQPGGSCYLPNTPIAHASYAMNMYYQKNGRNWWTCHFNSTGLVVFTDPSFGNCLYVPQW